MTINCKSQKFIFCVSRLLNIVNPESVLYDLYVLCEPPAVYCVNPGIGSYLSKPGQVPRRESGPGRCPSVPRGSARPRSGSGAGRLALAPPLKLMKVMLQVGEGTNIIVWSIGRTKACSVVVEHFPNSAQSIQSTRTSVQQYELGPPPPHPQANVAPPRGPETHSLAGKGVHRDTQFR